MKADQTNRFFSISGIRVNCLIAGETGPPVLLLHGGGVDSASLSWRNSMPVLARTHRVFAPDWPGYGESDPPPMPCTTEYYAGLLESLLHMLDVPKASLVGISMGGGIALSFTLSSPAAVENLILVSTYGLM